MTLFVLIFLLIIDGELHLGVKVDDGNKPRLFKTREACEQEKLKAIVELKEQLKQPFETYCITQKEYYKLLPKEGVTS